VTTKTSREKITIPEAFEREDEALVRSRENRVDIVESVRCASLARSYPVVHQEAIQI